MQNTRAVEYVRFYGKNIVAIKVVIMVVVDGCDYGNGCSYGGDCVYECSFRLSISSN